MLVIGQKQYLPLGYKNSYFIMHSSIFSSASQRNENILCRKVQYLMLLKLTHPLYSLCTANGNITTKMDCCNDNTTIEYFILLQISSTHKVQKKDNNLNKKATKFIFSLHLVLEWHAQHCSVHANMTYVYSRSYNFTAIQCNSRNFSFTYFRALNFHCNLLFMVSRGRKNLLL